MPKGHQPTDDELDKLYLRCWKIKHPETKKKFLTDGRLVFSNSTPYDIQFLLGEDGVSFLPLNV
jgi:hypothetical protein